MRSNLHRNIGLLRWPYLSANDWPVMVESFDCIEGPSRPLRSVSDKAHQLFAGRLVNYLIDRHESTASHRLSEQGFVVQVLS